MVLSSSPAGMYSERISTTAAWRSDHSSWRAGRGHRAVSSTTGVAPAGCTAATLSPAASAGGELGKVAFAAAEVDGHPQVHLGAVGAVEEELLHHEDPAVGPCRVRTAPQDRGC